MKKIKLSLLALLAISISTIIFTSCEDGIDGENGIDGANGIDGEDGTDASIYLGVSKTPNFLKVTSEFCWVKNYTNFIF